jgi:hypothetical protein
MSKLYAVGYGFELQESDPGVADEYRAGQTLPMLVKQFEVVSRFNLTPKQASSAISIPYFALVGNPYEQLGETYDGLLTLQEAREIGAQHRLDGQTANGFRFKENNLGIFGMDPKDKAAVSSASGRKVKRLKKGIFGLTPEQKIAMGQAAAADRGYVINETEEIILSYLMLEVPELRYGNGRRKLSAMAEIVNNAIHDGDPVRNENSLRSIWRRKKKFIASVSEEDKKRVKEMYLDDLLN